MKTAFETSRAPFCKTTTIAALAMAPLVGCGGTDSSAIDAVVAPVGSTGEAVDPGEPREAPGGDPEEMASAPLYVMTSNVWGDDGATGYLYTVRSLADGSASLADAIELPGGAWLYGRNGERVVYVSTGEGGPVITRWEVTDDGRLLEGPRISFAGLGLTEAPRFGAAQILSDDKAFVVDSAQHRVATWNPADMSVGSVIELDIADRDGLQAWLPTPVLRDDLLLVTVVWETDWRYGDVSRVVAIDTETDRVVEARDDARCEQLAIASLDSSGASYYSPYAHSAAARSVLGADYGSRSCGLRIVPPGSALDDAWEVDLAALAGGRPAGEFVLASDSVGFFRVYYGDEIGVTPETWLDSQSTPAFRWWRWEIGSAQAREIPNQALSVEAAHYVVDGKTYIGNPSADWAATTIVELVPDGALRPGLTVPGTPGGVIRAR